MGFELLPSDAQAAVGEARLLPQAPQVVGQLALGHLQHVHVGLAGDVDGVLDHAHLGGRGGRAKARLNEIKTDHQRRRASPPRALCASKRRRSR